MESKGRLQRSKRFPAGRRILRTLAICACLFCCAGLVLTGTAAEAGDPVGAFATDPRASVQPPWAASHQIMVYPALPMQLGVRVKVRPEYNDKAVISWDAVPGATGYEVYRGSELIAGVGAAGGQTSLCIKDRDLKTGRRYTYRVTAYQETGGVRVRGTSSGVGAVRAIHREPRLLMVATEGSRRSMPEEFRKTGCSVDFAYNMKEVDLDSYDALLVPGGGDVDPALWGEAPHPSVKDLDREKDEFQVKSIRLFAEAGKPVLGVCRGEQLVNVAFGGTMVQNLVPGSRTPTYEDGFRTVKVEEGSWAHRIYGDSPRVWFHHHQAVGDLGEGIRATAWSIEHEYPHIEAIEHESLPVYGVQWHPDSHVKEQGIEIYKAFRRVCLDYMAR